MKNPIFNWAITWLLITILVTLLLVNSRIKLLGHEIKENIDINFQTTMHQLETMNSELADRQLKILELLNPEDIDKDLEELKSKYDTEWCEDLKSYIDDKYIWYDDWFCTFQEIPFDEIDVDSPLFIKCEWMVAYENEYQWQKNLDLNHMPYKVIKSVASDRKAWENYFLEANYVMNNCKWFAYVKKNDSTQIVR